MPFLKTWREKISALARDFFKTRTKTKKFWRDFFKIPARLSGDFRLEICYSSFVYNLSYGVSFAPCKDRKTAFVRFFLVFLAFPGLLDNFALK
ncbi:conserved hypothetical protein [Porphyromonas gingivalis ATCC 33277]|uniref:Uncharacterized protein n=1 Tax=Porphyromonas gingivalis (strain ATCC 33277 / DSM 20709 / CIP 103683 / JCM 12257 / NCTC 11834 / 2561) TaxID=431947 RepID=B2RMF0_PORG3|nr:DUF1661 domain-containing protein [Porphyromonas gingivalis]BAG34545.1 conserved hypothetical protein [Porphyromonas gingivalis ATCC 33277]